MKAADARNNMKELVIQEYYGYIKKLSKGYFDTPYQSILDKILFIESFTKLDKLDSIYNKLANI